MTALQNKIDFVVLVSVTMANANGDPLNGNRPRTDYNGFGEMSDVCIKRKIRNRMQDLGHDIFVQSEDRATDGNNSLSERATKTIGKQKTREDYAAKACAAWLDVRSFGQVFAFKSDSVSVGVRGPVSIHQAVSVSPIEIQSMQITKSVNSESSEKRSSDTMGTKHFVRFGLYEIKGSINVQLAEKTGFSEEDARCDQGMPPHAVYQRCVRRAPDGSMEVAKVFWWRHGCKDGQYSSAKVHRSVRIAKKDDVGDPSSFEDYTVTVDELPGLAAEVIDGI